MKQLYLKESFTQLMRKVAPKASWRSYGHVLLCLGLIRKVAEDYEIEMNPQVHFKNLFKIFKIIYFLVPKRHKSRLQWFRRQSLHRVHCLDGRLHRHCRLLEPRQVLQWELFFGHWNGDAGRRRRRPCLADAGLIVLYKCSKIHLISCRQEHFRIF